MLKLAMLPFFAAVFCAAAGEPARTQWGSEVSDYRVWNWLESSREIGAALWKELEAEEHARLLTKAEKECREADASVKAADNGTDAAAILALSPPRLENVRFCLENGEDTAVRLGEKRHRLRVIMDKAKRGELTPADYSWLETSGIKLEDRQFQDRTMRDKGARQLEASKKREADINRRLGKLGSKKLGNAGLSGIYDGTRGTGGEKPPQKPAVGLQGMKGGSAGLPAERKPRATTISTDAPPELGRENSSAPENDADRLEQVLNGTVSRLVKEGKRLPGTGSIPSILNSAYGIWNGGKTERCYDQAESLIVDIGKTYGKQAMGDKFTDPSGRWTFKIDTYHGEGHEATGHYWVTAVSNNPDDPTLVMDPSLGTVTRYKEKNPVLKKGFLLYTEGYFIDIAKKTWAAVKSGDSSR